MAKPHLTEMDTTDSADSSTTTPLNTHTFNGHKWILKIQTLLADFVHYQNHVRLTALADLPEFITPPEERDKAHIIAHTPPLPARLPPLAHMPTSNHSHIHCYYHCLTCHTIINSWFTSDTDYCHNCQPDNIIYNDDNYGNNTGEN